MTSNSRLNLGFFVALISFLLSSFVSAAELQIEGEVEALLKRMTLEEKITLIAGKDMDTNHIGRLGIPSLKMCDGPVGVRWEKSTSFPSSIGIAASWDTDLVSKIAGALAKEVRAKGRHMLLAPCININRVPMGGRNFESFGEDPYLTSRLAVSYVKGLQQQNVIATPKHYACNNQEWERDSIDVKVDERALREIYLPAFEAAVKEGGAWSIMAAYNKVNGFHCTENKHLLNDILKKEWGFKGFVVSDWGATHSTVNAANFGLDLEMPQGDYFNKDLLKVAKDGNVKESIIDDKVRRILRVMFLAGLFASKSNSDRGALDSPEHREIALQSAKEGIVLLKNESEILPININQIRSIAVIGPNAAVNRHGGGGSSTITPFYSISPLDALGNRVGKKVVINYSLGCKLDFEVSPIDSSALFAKYNGAKVNGLYGEYFNNKDLRGEPLLKRIDEQINFDWGGGSPTKEINKDGFSVRWTGKLVPPSGGECELNIMSDDGVRFYLDGKLLIDSWRDQASEIKNVTVTLEAGHEYDLRIEYYENWGKAVIKLGWCKPGELLNNAVNAAKKSDMVVIFAGLSNKFESEGFDRNDLNLPASQNELIEKISEVNKNTIVVLNTGAPVLMDKWIDKVPAVIQAWYPGQEGGNAIADVLLGNFNPSGKSPITYPLSWEDCPAYPTYPGREGKTYYSEGIFVGYRYFDKKDIKALFPFGHGLSYTTFQYSNIEVTPCILLDSEVVNVSFDLKNTGEREGAEVAQLYLRDVESSVERPVKELKGFQRVNLKPGEIKKINFKLDKRAMSFYDIRKKDWVAEPGEYEVFVGSSSQDIRLKGRFVLEKEKLVKFIKDSNIQINVHRKS